MDDFRGEVAQYERLRNALRDLHAANVKSSQLERLAEKEARWLGTPAMSRTDIDKFRKGDVTRPRDIQKAFALWNVVFCPKFLLPTADRSEPLPPDDSPSEGGDGHHFFHSSVRFFDVHQHRQTRAEKGLLGRFAFYHFSEYFHKFASVQRAVVVGQWDIDLTGGAYCVEERQEYDGKIGRPQIRRDQYSGYCLPKGPNVCLILKEVHKETPKILPHTPSPTANNRAFSLVLWLGLLRKSGWGTRLVSTCWKRCTIILKPARQRCWRGTC